MKSFKEFCECVVRFDRRSCTIDTPSIVTEELEVHTHYDAVFLASDDGGTIGLFGEYTDDNGVHTYHTMIGNAEYTSLLMSGMMEILYREHYIPESCSQYNLPIKPSELINLRRTLFNVRRELVKLYYDNTDSINPAIESLNASINAVDDGIYGDMEARVDADMALVKTLKGEE